LAYRIPEEKITEVKNACDIVDMVSESVVLKQTGRNFIGLCPFHSEKTASFTVSPDKQIFHCFGCGESGNVISFTMKQNAVSFPEAVKLLAMNVGIELPDAGKSDVRQASLREQLLGVNRSALGFFRQCLTKDPRGRRARDYLNARGLDEATVQRFQLGYAPRGWDHLSRHLLRSGKRPEFIEQAGLAIRRPKGGGHYDRFRDRVIFPISDLSGHILGFGGRVMDDALPKYLNSPETPIYNKRRSLYGLKEARQEARAMQSVYIVEGYFDAIALHRHGLGNTVATLGTALTPEQVRLIKGFIGQSGKAVLVYDSDAAGIKAARRSIDVFNREFVDARILVLPQGHDPDSYISEFGKERFLDLSSDAKGVSAFLVDTAIERHGLEPEGKIRILAEVTPALASVTDPIDRGLIARDIAERLLVDEAVVMEKIRQHRPKSGDQPEPVAFAKGFSVPETLDRTEAKIISMMLQFTEVIDEIRAQNVVDCLSSPLLSKIGNDVLARMETGSFDVGDLISAYSEPYHKQLITTLAMADDAWTREGCLKLISRFVENTRHRRRLAELEESIKAAESAGDEETLLNLLSRKQALAVSIDRQRREHLDH
jgi:DNA primase